MKLLLTLLIFLLSYTQVIAADQTLTCSTNSSCSNIGTLFTLSDISSGDSFSRVVEIINHRNRTIDINITAEQVSPTSADLLELLNVIVREVGHGALFSGNMDQFLDSDTKIYIGGVPTNQRKEISITITLPSSAQNFKDKQVTFDINFAITEDESIHKSDDSDPESQPAIVSVASPAPQIVNVLGVSTFPTPSTERTEPTSPLPSPVLTSPSANPQVLSDKTVQFSWIYYLGLLFIILGLIIILWLLWLNRKKPEK